MNEDSFLRDKIKEFLEKEELMEILGSGSTLLRELKRSKDIHHQLFAVVKVLTTKADELEQRYFELDNTLYEHREREHDAYLDQMLVQRWKYKEFQIQNKLDACLRSLADVRRWQLLALSFLYELVRASMELEKDIVASEHLLELTDEGVEALYKKMYTIVIQDELFNSAPPVPKAKPLRLTREQEEKLNRMIVATHDRDWENGVDKDQIWKSLSDSSETELGFFLTPDAIRGRYERNWKKYPSKK